MDRATSLPDTELVPVGARLRAPYLLQQANYTIELARAGGEALAKVLAPGFLDKVAKLRDTVAQAFEDRTVGQRVEIHRRRQTSDRQT